MAVPTPTESEVWSMIRQACKMTMIRWQNEVGGTYYSQTGNSLTSQVGTFQALLEGLLAPQAGVAATAQLVSTAQVVIAGGRTLLDPLIYEMGKIIKSRKTNVLGILDDLFIYMAEKGTPDTVVNRAMGFGAVDNTDVAQGTDGTVVRCTEDRKGYTIENSPEGIVTLECIGDKSTGRAEHNEQFRVFGENPPHSQLVTPEYFGEGGANVVGPDLSLLDNASFEDDAALAGTGPSNWTTDSGGVTNIALNTTTKFIGSNSLQIDATEGINQDLEATGAGVNFNPDRPYCLAIAWNRNSAAGTLTIKLGSKSTNVVLAAQSGWQWLYLCKWYEQFKEDGLNVEIEWTKTSGSPLIDSVILAPMDQSPVDGTFFTILPASDSVGGYSVKDKYTFTDNHTDTGVIQFILHLLYGKYLPHAASSAAVIADPTFT